MLADEADAEVILGGVKVDGLGVVEREAVERGEDVVAVLLALFFGGEEVEAAANALVAAREPELHDRDLLLARAGARASAVVVRLSDGHLGGGVDGPEVGGAVQDLRGGEGAGI